MRVAVLGGTTEARELARALAAHPDIEVETSLAGPPTGPPPPGAFRVGRFGGPGELAQYLQGFDRVVDATHPFAAMITAQVVAVGVDVLVLRRPGWTAATGDDWRWVPSVEAAAAAVRSLPLDVAFLTIGRTGVASFAGDPRPFLIRSIEAPTGPLPVHHTLLLAQGPFTEPGEVALMRQHGVGVLVSKDSGGAAVAAKLTAARTLGLPVVMIERPPLPAGAPVVDSVAAAVAWVLSSSR